MAPLPNAFSIQMGIGSQWTQNYTFQNADGSLYNITGKTFEFVIRNDPSETSLVTPVVKVTSTPGPSGSVTANTTTSTITVVLSPSATAAMTQKSYVYSLWMDPGLADATAWVTGTVFANQIANV